MTLSVAALNAIAASAASTSAAALAGGTLELLDSGNVVLASTSLGTPTASGSMVTMGGYPRTTPATPGTIASARYRTNGGGDWKTGMTVGLAGSGAQVILSSLTISAGQTVTINSATLTHSVTPA